MKTIAVAKHELFREISVESFDTDYSSKREVPIYGDYCTQVAAMLNEVYKQNEENKEEQQSVLGRDLDDPLNEKPDYRVGKADVITGIDNTQVTIKESHLSVENVRPNIGTGMYDVGNEIARMTLGVDNCVIYSTNPTNVKFDTNLPTKLKELVIEGKQIILVIMLSDNSVAITDIELPVELVELMSNTNRITVYACYQMN